MRLLLLLGLVACATPASAQSVAFRPLAIGNAWTYAARATSSTTATSCTLPAADTYYLRAEVVRDTTIGGAAARVLRCTQVALDGHVLSQSDAAAATLAFDPSPATASECSALFAANPPYGSPKGSYTVDIGGVSYPMLTVAFRPETTQGPGGFSRDLRHDYADRVGMYAFDYSYNAGTPRGCATSRYRLVAAVVDGEAFGVNPVDGEESPEVSTARPLRAYPVPATQAVTIESAERATVEVVDALGRRVASGEAAPGRPLRLDVSAWPAGVYVARSTGASGIQTARLVVTR